MRKVIAYIDNNGCLWADENQTISDFSQCEDYEVNSKVNIAELAALGYTADDLVKMKAAGVI